MPSARHGLVKALNHAKDIIVIALSARTVFAVYFDVKINAQRATTGSRARLRELEALLR